MTNVRRDGPARRASVGLEALEGRALLAATPLSAGDILIQENYLVYLNRTAEAAGLAGAQTLLSVSRGSVTLSLLLAQGAEAAAVRAGNAYRVDLGRGASPAEVQAAAGLLQAGGSPYLLGASLLSSTEFYKAAGNTDLAFVTSLYQHILGRAPDAAGAGAALSALGQGVSRFVLAYDLLTGPEAAMDTANADYQAVLGRDADPAGLAAAVQELSSEGGRPPVGSEPALLAGLLNSQENMALIQADIARLSQFDGTAAAVGAGLIQSYALYPGEVKASFATYPNGIGAFAGIKSSPSTITVTNQDPSQALVFTPTVLPDLFYPIQIPSSDITFLDNFGNPLAGPITVQPGQSASFQVVFDLTNLKVDLSTFGDYGATIGLINPYGRVLTNTNSTGGVGGTIGINLTFFLPQGVTPA